MKGQMWNSTAAWGRRGVARPAMRIWPMCIETKRQHRAYHCSLL